MRNPLNKRLPRELKQDLGKYIVIFLFLVILISVLSGFLVANGSMISAYNDGYEKYKLEDGHFALNKVAPEELIKTLEEKADIKVSELWYFEEEIEGTSMNVRTYIDRDEVNLECVLKGEMPKANDEIAVDRMFADNNDLAVGDKIVLNGHELTITALIAVPDYSCLFENNADMMFDSINFTIAVMTEEGFESVGSSHITYNYAWRYSEKLAKEDDIRAKELSDKLLDICGEVFEEYNKNLVLEYMKAPTEGESIESIIIKPTDYLPRYLNNGINFTGEDMGTDRVTFLIFGYLVIIVIAFIFAVTTSNTIASEAGVIGTLRASGYTRGEIIRHYMIIPMIVIVLAGIVGNILGYTVLKDVLSAFYYGSYSLPTFEVEWNSEAFILTTVVPIVMMFFINLIMLVSKLRLSPLRFLRRDISRRGKKKAFRLNTKIPFVARFRMRILFQNIPNYIVLFCGIFLGAVLVVFSLMFGPMFEKYADRVLENKICSYQYVLKEPEEISNAQAEKYAIGSLKTMNEHYKIDDISIYGIAQDSNYVTKDIPAGEVLVSNGFAAKYKLSDGSEFSLKDPYSSKTYSFKVAESYEYDAALSVFMNISEFNDLFGYEQDYFSGYFSNEELKDELGADNIATVITEEDLTKISTQLEHSLGSMVGILKGFGVVMFLLLMYTLSKQIIEKNAKSISIVKILGFTDGEIGGLYIIATSVVVLLALIITIPLCDIVLRWIFSDILYVEMTGYIPYIMSGTVYVKMFVMGAVCYAVVSFLQMIKIGKVPKSDALKMVE